MFCSEGELWDDGDSLSVGDVVDRLGRSWDGGEAFSGSALEPIRWQLSRDADPELGLLAVVSGTIVGIEAVSVTMTAGPEGGWRRERGSARLEPRTTTSGTDRPPQRVDWTSTVVDESTGVIARAGFGTYEEGDEVLEGWVLTLVDEHLREIEIDPA